MFLFVLLVVVFLVTFVLLVSEQIKRKQRERRDQYGGVSARGET